MKTAVVTINYNNVDDTVCCIKSLVKHSPDAFVVVVDNASQKNNVEAVVKYAPNNIKVLKLKKNLGFGRGNNAGIKWALDNLNSEYILLINNDTEVESDVIGLMESYMDAHPEYSGCSPRIVYAHDPDMLWYGGGELKWRTNGAISWNINKKYDGNVVPEEVTFITGCVMMIRRASLEIIGGFDPRYFMYAEDIELCARLQKYQYKLVYLPEIVVLHRSHGSLRSQAIPFVDPESPENPKLPFYLENSMCNILLNLDSYGSGSEKIMGMIYLFLKWGIKKSLIYLAHGRVDGVYAILKGGNNFLKLRKKQFIDELNSKNTFEYN
ncbi:MAG: glycosyltransferase family 2 protein [Proteobacteria bacterium]|nr:glycosyltransferase family 2 protein [Pseudomonadota bacterium]